jgi:alcohol dehydrogenase
MPETMRAAVFKDVRDIHIEEVPVPRCGPTDAIVKVTTTTICGTDSHIWRGEYPVAPGRVVGHEPAGVIHEVGESVTGYEVGDRVVVGAITPCGTCYFCQSGDFSQCAGYEDQWGIIGGWRLGNSMDGVQAEYFRVPYAQANLAKIPEGLSDEEVLFVTDIATTGISAVETANVELGDSVVVFAQGPIGLCATAGAKLSGASLVIGVDRLPFRLSMARRMGADHVIDASRVDPVEEIMRITAGRGVDVSIEALGTQQTFEACLRVLRPGGTLSSLGVYATDLTIPRGAFASGLGDHRIVTTLCPGGKERMRRLMSLIASQRVDLGAMVTHRFKLDDIEAAYELFAHQRDGVLKVAITP